MNSPLVYLKPNVQIEPLVDQWYAWSHLIPPATAARNVTERHLRIMDSYLSAPSVHAAAVSNPRFMGGPFMDYDRERTQDVQALRDRTKSKRPHLLALSDALVQLDDMLLANAKGFSLTALYAQVPEALKGYVELVYDINNHPSFRLIEPLLYRSEYYDRSLQSLMLSTIDHDERPFALSTPRLGSPDTFHWRRSFEEPVIDELCRLKTQPRPLAEVKELMVGDGEFVAPLDRFFTEEPPPRYQRYSGPAARWRYFGHACVLVETAHVSMLFDPVVSYGYHSEIPRYTYADLPDVIDYVLITHNHQDHILLETLLQIRHKVGCVVVPKASSAIQDPSLKLTMAQLGFRHVIELGEMDELPFEHGSITALPFFGEHADLDIRGKSAYLVRVGGHSLLFAADSCNVEPKLYEHVHREVGDVDALFVGMECVGAPLTWLYGPLLPRRIDRAMDASRRLAGSNFEQALQIVERFRCRETYVYAMGQEPWLNYVMSLKYTERSKPIVESNKLVEHCRNVNIVAERLFGEREMFLA